MIGYQQLALVPFTGTFHQAIPKLQPYSQNQNTIQQLQNMTFYGVNNTPLFDYENDEMQPNAVKGYN